MVDCGLCQGFPWQLATGHSSLPSAVMVTLAALASTAHRQWDVVIPLSHVPWVLLPAQEWFRTPLCIPDVCYWCLPPTQSSSGLSVPPHLLQRYALLLEQTLPKPKRKRLPIKLGSNSCFEYSPCPSWSCFLQHHCVLHRSLSSAWRCPDPHV